MKILVISGTGHVGRLVVDELVREELTYPSSSRAIVPGLVRCPAKSSW